MHEKNRHGCLTAYLVFMIIANSGTALYYLFGSNSINQLLPGLPSWSLPILGIFGVINLICAVALFKWKKWGFYGFCLSALIVAGLNTYIGFGMGTVIQGLLGIPILYGILHIGKHRKGWAQLD